MRRRSPAEPLEPLDDGDVDSISAIRMIFDSDSDVLSGPYGEAFRAIILGTVAQAVSDYVRHRNSSNSRLRKDAQYAEAWLFTKTDPYKDEVLGSFEWVCMVLDRDPEIPRERIRSMRVSDLPKIDRRSSR